MEGLITTTKTTASHYDIFNAWHNKQDTTDTLREKRK